MINITDEIIFKSTGEQLDSGVRNALMHVTERFTEEYGPYTGQSVRGNTNLGFQRFFPVSDILIREEFTEKYVKDAFSTIRLSTREIGSNNLSDIVLINTSISPNYFGSIRRGLSIFLVHLWSKNHILLPTTFAPNHHGRFKVFSRELYTDGLAYFDSLLDDDYIRPEDAMPISDPVAFTIEHLVNRMFYASDWHSLEDVNLQDMSNLRAANLAAKKGLLGCDFGQAGYPMQFVLAECLYVLKDKASFTESQLNDYIRNVISDVGRQSDKEEKRLSNNSINQAIYSGATLSGVRDDLMMLAASSEATSETILEYLVSQRISRNRDNLSAWYIGREGKCDEKYQRSWVRIVDEFIAYWARTNESTEGKRKTFDRFFDYLFLYLPWWKEIYGGKVNLPLTPKDLTRAVYISRHKEVDIEELPLTYSEFLLELFPTSQKTPIARAMHSLRQLFEWVAAEYEDDETIAGNKFSNPVKRIDCEYKGQGRTKTNKVRIPKTVYPFLLGYTQAVHAYLEWYQEAVLERLATNKRRKCAHRVNYEVESYGFCPVFYHNDVMYRIDVIPPVYGVYDDLTIIDNGKNKITCKNLPSLASIRLLMVMLDTGLRGAAVEWLDRSSYKKGVEENGRMYTQRLFVSTDKAKENGFYTRVFPRVMEVIDKEVALVNRIVHPNINIPQPYMNRRDSRFGDIYPIFCGTSNRGIGRSIPRSIWSDAWIDLLEYFKNWYNMTFDSDIETIIELEALDADGSVKVDKNGDVVFRKRAIHTPHSIRSTVISERLSVMPVRVSAALVGHKNEETNIYYYQPEDEEIDQMMKVSDVLCQPTMFPISFDKESANYVKPSKGNSNLITSFKKSREITSERFGFTSVSLTQTEYDSEGNASHLTTGMDVIDDVPLSRVIFHDTHICPVGDTCPSDILEEIKEPHRCGLCRLAVKSVDNIPAIGAIKLAKEDRSKTMREKAVRMRKNGESESKVARFYEQSDYDAMEAIGWHLAETVLYEKLSEMMDGNSTEDAVHVDDPEMLKEKIRVAKVVSDDAILLLKRIADSNAYVDLQSESIRSKARRLQRMMFKDGDTSIFSMDDDDPVKSLCSRITSEMAHRNLSVDEIVVFLGNHRKEVLANKQKRDALESSAIAGVLVLDEV